MWKSLTVLTLAAVLLGGCSMVTSETPMFSTADAVGSPEIRDGLWGAENCRPAEVRKAVRRWKACDWVLKRGGEWLSLDEEAWEATPFMIANGAPLVAQLQDKPLAYLYYGLEPLEQDARGGVIRARYCIIRVTGPWLFRTARLAFFRVRSRYRRFRYCGIAPRWISSNCFFSKTGDQPR